MRFKLRGDSMNTAARVAAVVAAVGGLLVVAECVAVWREGRDVRRMVDPLVSERVRLAAAARHGRRVRAVFEATA